MTASLPDGGKAHDGCAGRRGTPRCMCSSYPVFRRYTFRDRGPCKSLFRCCKRSAFKLFGCRKKAGSAAGGHSRLQQRGKDPVHCRPDGHHALESVYTDRASFTYMVPEEQAEDLRPSSPSHGRAGRSAQVRNGLLRFGGGRADPVRKIEENTGAGLIFPCNPGIPMLY